MVQALCGFWLLDGPGPGELGWGEVAVGGVGPVLVVVGAPVLDDHSSFEEAAEGLDGRRAASLIETSPRSTASTTRSLPSTGLIGGRAIGLLRDRPRVKVHLSQES